MIELLDYDPYGTERISWSSSSTDGSAESQKTYIGEYSDDESGLSYLNARYYNPGRGQFLSQDTVHLSLGSGADKREQVALLDPQMQNSYAYARNNPVKHTDPDGEFLPFLAVAAYMGVQAALSAWDIYSTYETFQDPSSSDTAKALTFGLTVFGLMDPFGGGYTGAGKALLKLEKGNARSGITHIVNGHRFDLAPTGKSKFLEGMGESKIADTINEGLENVSSSGWMKEGNGLYTQDVNLGRTIGFDDAGKQTSTLHIVKNGEDNIVTAYPFTPKE